MKMWYITPYGREIDLLHDGDWFVGVAYGGISGMVGTVSSSTVSAVGVPGELVTNDQIPKMTGDLTLHVAAGVGHPPVDEVAAEIRKGVQAKRDGTLVLDMENGNPIVSTPVRRNGVINPPVEVLRGADYAEMRVPLVSFLGGWLEDVQVRSGNVTVTNNGDAFLWPTLMVKSSGSITLPSGESYEISAPAGSTISLDPYSSHEVVHPDGTVDEAASALTEVMNLGEGIPEGESRSYITTGGVHLMWQILILDPWG
ncbi:hypothetical protein [Corynebacterium callunae]|uniref:hypothetical protein n=1 Tax=Corynebacterium callunae TaxID=1721 RepID=UPI001FFECC2E|nr:hypothetical protein [Corynebacterium callunae]MCK2199201.1 hypothetical protein [Corynebacterium callunae]